MNQAIASKVIRANYISLSTEQQTIGQRVKAVRNQLGLTQGELGEKMGTSRVTINNIERSLQKTPIDFLIKLAALSNRSIDSILSVSPQIAGDQINHLLDDHAFTDNNDQIIAIKSHISMLENQVKERDAEIAQLQQRIADLETKMGKAISLLTKQ